MKNWQENCRSNQLFLDEVIMNWLQKVDQVEEVSWAALVKALRHPRLGQNGIASKISADYGLECCSGHYLT